ncbi:HAD-IC family P-type ATPase [Labrenzia sp. CE80]|uniref:cation-translocating P-type ATPase n=1 Tax=Labrenzia sp. CE80 TaxID=1788986 RepID=UPI00257063DB|nr:HAD-IC family P-type ATPase [Labrenzia sp. CE80]
MSTNAPWHSLPVDDALKHFHSRQSGLTPEEAARVLQEYGPNTLPSAKPRSLLQRFLHQFNSVLIYVLLGCAGITLMLGHLTDSLVILAAVIANALIGIIQEGRAENAMASISKILSPQATVLRDARRLSTEGRNVVPGDIVVLEAGERVPADLRLLRANSLFIQEAILTGESVAVEKQTAPVPKDVAIAERSCMAYSGTMVTMGEGLGVVIATGTQSEIGRISGLLSDIEELQTPLLLKMGIFARWLTALILILGTLLFAYGHAVLHQDPQLLFMSIVGLSVAAIPEGLPAVLTITLAIGVQAMAKRNAIVRRLPSIETLGSVSVICTDKTGTLTFNEMSVTNICLTTGEFSVRGKAMSQVEGSCDQTMLHQLKPHLSTSIFPGSRAQPSSATTQCSIRTTGIGRLKVTRWRALCWPCLERFLQRRKLPGIVSPCCLSTPATATWRH